MTGFNIMDGMDVCFENEEAWPSLDIHCAPGSSITHSSILWAFYWEIKEQQSKVLILTLEPSAGR